MDKQQEQINEINSVAKATLGVSKIHGIGVIALADIYRGDTIHAYRMPVMYSIPYGSLGKLFTEVKEEILKTWPNVINGSNFIYPNSRLLSYMNHSSDPTKINYDALTDRAIINIPKGSEIFEDYRNMENWQKIFPWIDTPDMV